MHEKAKRIQQMKIDTAAVADPALADRLPPGQVWTGRFPILHEGEVPAYDMSSWSLRLFGEVENERSLSFDEILHLPQTEVRCDIHCVTRWSKADTVWQGVRFRDLVAGLKVKPGAKYVMIHADPDYDTNVPLADLLGDQVLLAHSYNGAPLTPKHGYPLRLLVPHLYFWKSAKWIRGIEFMKEDRLGFWERNGFHAYGDPFGEERFSGEALPIPEDEWVRKEYD
ncbi:oxidoreductase [Gordoniibacillus kamchatkensis]|uniref:Oxidoreductase n=1 Tax=Gordoniibacillus kamchatkensis TaxID=1590651 RepID=A0ABR5AN06_9BACL|nr:sulfite oxidase-like oxidoreductase [Paenibacillus sp. VKM B-2647]KIL42352.1 oxidoreductase [Paenibacillus sp. VKM B-2647]